MKNEIKSVGLHCPLCGSTGAVAFVKEGVPLRYCCGTLLCWVWDSVDDYENQYKTMDYHQGACVALGLPTQLERFEEHRKADICRIEWLRKRLKWESVTVLDVGSSNGAFVFAASNDIPCAEAVGLEPNPQMCDWAREKHGKKVIQGSWQDINGQWNLIVANDVIEHLTNPEGFLLKAFNHSDYLYMETPDFNNSRPTDWKHIKLKEHICLFSEDALVKLAERTGWKLAEAHNPIEGKLGVLFKQPDL
jgi:SAM-dependent methyltransferase